MDRYKTPAIGLAVISIVWIGVYYASGRTNTLALALGALAAVSGYAVARRSRRA
ncbi:hypothetical protein ACIGDM_10235 [Rothia koreensis]|uniref:hypothetical protein n=1 Tax=Rothia koreensis TaxID=592378 RepID=UPI0037C5420E